MGLRCKNYDCQAAEEGVVIKKPALLPTWRRAKILGFKINGKIYD